MLITCILLWDLTHTVLGIYLERAPKRCGRHPARTVVGLVRTCKADQWVAVRIDPVSAPLSFPARVLLIDVR